MEAYRLYAVVPPVLDFIEDLTNWYIRLSRKRFWGTDSSGNGVARSTQEAYETLYYVLLKFSQVFAPFAPFAADRLYEILTDQNENSVHLTEIPSPDKNLIDLDLEKRMELVRTTANLGRSLRAKHQIKTRQVLPSMMIITRHTSDGDAIEKAEALIKSELNIKEISFTTEEAKYVRLSLKPNLKTLGRRLGKELKSFRDHLAKLNESHDDVAALLVELEEKGKVSLLGHELTDDDFLIERGPKDDRLIATERGVTVLLDTHLTDELILEGLSREIVNRVQKLRKDSGLQVTDRITLAVSVDGKLQEAVEAHRDYIARETLANDVQVNDQNGELAFSSLYDIDNMNCRIGFEISNS
jgi:isoleucyl-tRNA synthetase